jgi:very-short-patch-repair endonuclease
MSKTVVSRHAIQNARKLRHEMTEGEKRLWRELKTLRTAYGVHVRKQVPFGPYVADFAIHGAKLIIEVDGEFHQFPERETRDVARDQWFAKAGYCVLRFSTGDVSDALEGCVRRILEELGIV